MLQKNKAARRLDTFGNERRPAGYLYVEVAQFDRISEAQTSLR